MNDVNPSLKRKLTSVLMKTEQEHSEKDEQDDIYFLQRQQNFSFLLHNLKLKSDTLETNESKENEHQSTRTIVSTRQTKNG